MASITFDIARRPGTEAAGATPARQRKGFWAHVLAHMIEARQRQAIDDIRLYRHLLPRELEQAGWKVDERSEDSLPFVR